MGCSSEPCCNSRSGWRLLVLKTLTSVILVCGWKLPPVQSLSMLHHRISLSGVQGCYYHHGRCNTHIISSSSFCSRATSRPAGTNIRKSKSSSLNMFLGQDAGFLGIGAPEIATIVLVGYFVLGPSELYKLVKDIGKFITNIRTVGAEATASFEGAMENQLALNEIRKAQVELNDAFSFRRSINSESLISTTTEEPSSKPGSSAAMEQQQQPELVTAGVATVSSPGSTPKKKKRRKVKRQPAVVEDIDMNDDSQFESMTTAFENAEEERMRKERLARLEASLEESDRLWEKRMQEMQEKEQEPLSSEYEESSTASTARFQSQLSPDWNQQVLSRQDELQPLAKIMEQLALLEEERNATMNRLEEEYRRKEETELLFYEKKRALLKSAASSIQQHISGEE